MLGDIFGLANGNNYFVSGVLVPPMPYNLNSESVVYLVSDCVNSLVNDNAAFSN